MAVGPFPRRVQFRFEFRASFLLVVFSLFIYLFFSLSFFCGMVCTGLDTQTTFVNALGTVRIASTVCNVHIQVP
ncbi:hypothetical protein BDV32DRAFT_124929 [Aspergillus pseudonomiae]|nr:hypothetical protein BDV32DRAFT_124929 [Aspergillus pseudonomiae]